MNINESSSSELTRTNSTINATIASPTVPVVAIQPVMDSTMASVITDANNQDTNIQEYRTNNVTETYIRDTSPEFDTLPGVTAITIPVSHDTTKDINFISLQKNSSMETTIPYTNDADNTLEPNIEMQLERNVKMFNYFVPSETLQLAPIENLIPISGTIDGVKSPERTTDHSTIDVMNRTLSEPSAAAVFPSNSLEEFTPTNIGTGANQNVQPMSYASMSRNTGALPKQKTKQVKNESKINWTPQLGRIIKSHNKGHRVLILMRGLPGSGKSFLARQVIELTVGNNPINYKNHIFSTDDYFSLRGKYEFNKQYLSVAHEWNKSRVKEILEKGFSPIIVDNTSIENWEMEPYLRDGVRNGYIINVMEPKTPWAKKPNQLLRRNQHGVPIKTIIRMLDNFRDNITFEYLMDFYRLSYPANMKPPVLRNNLPVDTPQYSLTNTTSGTFVQQQQFDPQSSIVYADAKGEKDNNLSSSSFNTSFEQQSSIVLSADINAETGNTLASPINEKSFLEQQASKTDTDSIDIVSYQNTENGKNALNSEQKNNLYTEIETQLEEMEKVEQEWENGEQWDEVVQEKVKNICIEETLKSDPKPPRSDCIERTGDENLLKSVNNCQDWRQISMFMPPWNNETVPSLPYLPEAAIEIRSSGTCMEIGDTDIFSTGNFQKVISATPRNINEYHIAPTREKIPEKRMLDKSSMTNERLITEAYRCENEERHFVAFRKMFKSIAKSALRDIFDKCCGDVNWAVEIVLDGMANNQLQTVDDDEISDVEEENSDQCSCLAAYNIIPDTSSRNEEILDNIPEQANDNDNVSQQTRKIKREIPISDMSLQLKRQMEQNFVISDDHYSEHCLKIRKMRRGELNTITNNSDEATSIEETQNAQAVCLYTDPINAKASSSHNTDSDNESSNASFEELENVVNINLGREFISVLDDLFGRKDMTYPESVEPKISIPVYLLNEINALWMESLMYQLDQRDKQLAIMIQQDAEFARQLLQKEIELAQTGKEPEVPDFKEIMDMDFAISIYQKDIAEWRNKEPNDLAAKLSRDKLYNLFPELPQDTLSELLMAHDNNFQTTVEVLLMSTGKSKILEEKNGLNKFVMQKEIERKEKILAEEKKALSEVQWPLLPLTDNVSMSDVNNYRNEADKHLHRRNISYQKAQEFIRRGMLQVASYYSDIATFHKQRFDQANSLAAASLIQVHAANSPNNATIDLHYLRVGEAKESLDLFLDMHITKLRESKAANRGPREHTLFFITGRGLHSNGGPKVKPAVKKRLRERGLAFSERNPGLLSAKVSAEDKLSYQIQIP